MANLKNLFIRIPYHILVERIKTVLDHHFNVEVYFDADSCATTPLCNLRKIKKTMDGAGLQLILHGPYLDLNPASLDSKIQEVAKYRYLQSLHLASFLGATQITLHHGYNPIYHSFAYDEWHKRSIGFWEKITEEAQRHTITIGIENAFEEGPHLLKDVVSRVDSPYLGCCLDVGHLNVGSKVGLKTWVEEIGSRIVEIHLHDNDGCHDDHLALGEGKIDFRLLFKLLNEIGIHPILTLEQKNEEDFLRSISWLRENLPPLSQ